MRRHILIATAITAALLVAGCTTTAGTRPGTAPSGASSSSAIGSSAPSSSAVGAGGLAVEVEPAYGYGFVDSAIASATGRVELVMYELSDASVEQALVAAAIRGVTVEVLLDSHLEQSTNQAAYQYLSAHGVAVHWGPSAITVHQKSLCIDQTVCYVMTGNLTPQYYSSTRDFVVTDTQLDDISAIESTFAADFAGQPVSVGQAGSDLLWSPGSQSALLAFIDEATTTLLVENEEMDSTAVVGALEQAARRGVRVEVVMTAQSQWDQTFDELSADGVEISTYSEESPQYIHAKAMVADGDRAFVGSENFSTASMQYNRELGIVTGDPSVAQPLSEQMSADFDAGARWSG